ncbi:hypothetical protein EMIT0194P_260029 [Pseudomonas serbica]
MTNGIRYVTSHFVAEVKTGMYQLHLACLLLMSKLLKSSDSHDYFAANKRGACGAANSRSSCPFNFLGITLASVANSFGLSRAIF